MGKSKFFYDLQILEKKTLLPSTIKALLKKLEDYGYVSFEVAGLAGTVEKSGEEYLFTARGSGQKYGLKATEGLKKLAIAGKTSLTLAGKVAQDGDKARPTLEVTEAKETAK